MTPTEINAAVAERLGIEPPFWKCPNHGEVSEDRIKVSEHGKFCPWCHWQLALIGSDFAGSLDAAMQLVDHAWNLGYKPEMVKFGSKDHGPFWRCSFMERAGFGHKFGGPVEQAETLSAAICEAYLKLPIESK
jgi:hypothetical protein